MKTLIEDLIRVSLVLLLLLTYVLEPMEVYAESKATTLAELRQELKTLQNQKQNNQNQVSGTKSEINKKNEEIANAYSSIEKAENDIEIAKQEIEDSNKEIEELTAKTKKMLSMYVVTKNQDVYLEYISGASSISDLIMRSDAIENIVSYNKDNITKLEELINTNEALQIDLLNKQDDLQKDIATYQTKVASLKNNLSQLVEITEDIDDQIKNQQALIKWYEDIGCKDNQNLDECVNMANNTGWLKPLIKARVTSLYGYRVDPISGKYSLHNGIDLAGNVEGTKIYSATSGYVAAVTPKSSCGGNKVYVHSVVNGVKYTITYCHLLTVSVKVGDILSNQSIIGTVGGGSGTKSWDKCSTGAHLHFGVSKGYYLGSGTSSYSTYVANSMKPPGFPGKGVWFYSRTQWFN